MRALIGAIVVLTIAWAATFMTGPAQAQYYRYYGGYGGYYGGWRTWNGCPPGWTIQGGVCKPYRYGPWDNYNYGYNPYRYRYYGHRYW